MTTVHSLQDLGHLRSGYQYRSAKDLESGEPYQAVQLGVLAANGELDWSSLEPMRFEGDPKQYLLRTGDVLFPLRGGRTAAVAIKNPPEDAFVVGHWAILTPDSAKADGTYLAWYWNHPAICKRREYEMSKGSNIQFISMRDCRSFKVQLPPLERQRQVARVAELWQQEQKLTGRLEELKDKLINAATMQAAIEE
ncbi:MULTISPECIES: restriction endonuclease subunit S [Cyanophyceae]|uniref:Restriction endonuclease subunit S n=2 Tax=Cyanophyceae TaxID=3028117 RepID=A0A4Q7E6S1_9CYAN|nr:MULTISPECIES: restriction endonuclease subunit S [Cyanophyceae]MCM1983700.1 restriction endonuclease subunit S [Lyngbya confervoides BDU141951]RZM77804.1 restriction endonuclease subunit S [Leptolyngbya sp. LK]